MIVPAIPASATLKESSSTFKILYWTVVVVIPVDVVNPEIFVLLLEYSITSPSPNPWSLNVIKFEDVFIPIFEFTLSFLLVYQSTS